jgi:hypothetical protein
MKLTGLNVMKGKEGGWSRLLPESRSMRENRWVGVIQMVQRMSDV